MGLLRDFVPRNDRGRRRLAIQRRWIPASAGMTERKQSSQLPCFRPITLRPILSDSLPFSTYHKNCYFLFYLDYSQIGKVLDKIVKIFLIFFKFTPTLILP